MRTMLEISRIIKRDIGSQINTSRNLGEGRVMKIRRAFWSAVYLLKAVRCGLNSLREEQLGSTVYYLGRRCFVSNWAGSSHPTLADGEGFYQERCDRSQIRNSKSLSEFLHRFVFGISFYTSNWHGIDVNKRLYK